jgi:hypothetical protein
MERRVTTLCQGDGATESQPAAQTLPTVAKLQRLWGDEGRANEIFAIISCLSVLSIGL